MHANAITFCMQSVTVLSNYDNFFRNMYLVVLLSHIYFRNCVVAVSRDLEAFILAGIAGSPCHASRFHCTSPMLNSF